MIAVHDGATAERATFTLTGFDVALTNVLRHALYADVDVYAPDTVTFIQYDGPLEPELIAHMIGQLPLRRTDDVHDDVPVTFAVDVQTDASTPSLTWVSSVDFTCTSGNAEIVHFRSDKERAAAFADTGFLLCPLHAGQRFVATFTATLNNGRHGTRWNSVHPIVRPLLCDDAETTTPTSFELIIQTTGAITPTNALRAALKVVLQRVSDCSSACSACVVVK